MHTLFLIGLGFTVLAALVLFGRKTEIGFAVLRPWFTGFWGLAAAINIYVTVAFARQPFAAELPSFIVIAVLPIAAAYALRLLGIGRE